MTLRLHGGYWESYTDEELITEGHEICRRGEDGEDGIDLLLGMTRDHPGIEPEDIGYLMGVATEAWCPQYTEQMLEG